MPVKDNLLVIRMGVAGLTQWGLSWARERLCGGGGIRKNCGKVWKRQRQKGGNPFVICKPQKLRGFKPQLHAICPLSRNTLLRLARLSGTGSG